MTATDRQGPPRAAADAAQGLQRMTHPAPVLATGYRIRLADGSAEVSATPGQSGLAAFERLGGTAVKVGCRNGGCGACRVRVLDGQVRAEKMSLRHVNSTDRAS